MITLREALMQLSANDRVYSEIAEVVQTYRVKDQQNLGMTYDAEQHTKCDVRLIKDGSIVYDVLLTPAEVTSADTVYDGTAESPSGTIQINVPKISSKVFISWLNSETAFVSMNTFTESIIVGSSEGAYMDFYIRDESRIISLVNCDEFNVQFNNGDSFTIKTDTNTDLSELIVVLDQIKLATDKGSISIDDETIQIVSNGGKIDIHNNTTNIKDILSDTVQAIQDYITTVNPGLTTAGSPISPTVISSLATIKTRIDNLFV